MTAILNRYALIAFGLAVLFGGLFYIGVTWERDRRELDTARDYIEGTQDADQATDDVRSVGARDWLCRTFGGEGCGASGPDAPVD